MQNKFFLQESYHRTTCSSNCQLQDRASPAGMAWGRLCSAWYNAELVALLCPAGRSCGHLPQGYKEGTEGVCSWAIAGTVPMGSQALEESSITGARCACLGLPTRVCPVCQLWCAVGPVWRCFGSGIRKVATSERRPPILLVCLRACWWEDGSMWLQSRAVWAVGAQQRCELGHAGVPLTLGGFLSDGGGVLQSSSLSRFP